MIPARAKQHCKSQSGNLQCAIAARDRSARTRRGKANLVFLRSVFIRRDGIQTFPMKPYSVQATQLPLMYGTGLRMRHAAAPGTHHFLYVTCKRVVYNCEIQSINSTALCGPLFMYLFPFPVRKTSPNVTMKRLRNNSSDATNNNGPFFSLPLFFLFLFAKQKIISARIKFDAYFPW